MSEDTASDPVAENMESAAIIHANSGSSTGALLLKLWNAVMLTSTIFLSFYVLVLKDNSVLPFVALGIIGLSLPPIVNVFRSMSINKQLRIEREKRMEEARLERIREAQEREATRQKREQLLALNEEDIQEAIKNIDIEAIKINNSME